MAKKIDYNARNFADVRSELVGFVKQYYPDIYSDFNDASVGMMLLELNAAVGDMLSFHTDRMFNETHINYAQERSSLLELARTFGLNVPGNRPSISIVDWSVTVPVDGDTFDLSYAPIVLQGSQATGSGKVFELVEDSDFSSPFTTGGIPNRLIIPNINSEGKIENYTLTKREIVLNGFTKIYKRVINREDYKPFLEIVLPETNVLSVERIIFKEGTNLTTIPTLEEFNLFTNNFFEMNALAQAEVFIEDTNTLTDNPGIRPGKWLNAPKRFIKEFTDKGFCKVILGGGDSDTSALNDFVGCRGQVDRIGNFVNNLSLGEIARPNTTLFIKYRVGGGADSNLGSNSISKIGTTNVIINGDDQTINKSVRESLRVNNPIPAIGGKGAPSLEEIRNLVRYNFSSQERAVTIKDYKSRIALMPGKFGVPFRCGVWEERNKVNVSILALDENTKLSNKLTSTLKNNIAEYLAEFRMLNDYVTINDGKVINLGFEVDLFVEKGATKSEVVAGVSQSITSFMDINSWDMGDNIYLAQLIENVNNVGGVLNVIDLRVYNKVAGSKYSVNEIAQPYIDEDTRQIDLLSLYTLFGEQNAMFEVKYPNSDIKIRIKTA
tara:strand:+ start:6760 stop:8583 length:1824 start_codon:yes stop_codon:yes gene_type:complete